MNNPKIDQYGNKFWYNKEGQLHREDGPAVEYTDGTKKWYKNGKFHRENGPAKEFPNGSKEWFQNGLLHRLDGPAFENPDDDYKEFWISNIQLTESEFINFINIQTEEIL